MTKKKYLEDLLRASGITGVIYESLKKMSEDEGSYYAGILRGSDKPVRSKSKKIYDNGAVTMNRVKLYDMETVYTVVIAEYDEEHLEAHLEAFFKTISKGYDDGNGNWVGVEAGEVDWVDEKDSILKAKIAVEIPVTFTYGIYKDDVPVDKIEGKPEIGMEKE